MRPVNHDCHEESRGKASRPDPNDPHDEAPRPNPCAPEGPGSDPCDCHATPPPSARPDRPRRPPPRKDDCCAQILELIRELRGAEGLRPHKPKQRPARKVQDLCDSLGIREAVLPLVVALWERREAGEKGRNLFEQKVDHIFGAFSAEESKAFGEAVAGYRRLRRSGKGECLWNDCLADAAREGPVEAHWVAEEMLREGLKLAGQLAFRESKGVLGPGQVRLWDNAVARGPNGSGATIYQGPWPWVTAIVTDFLSYEEYGNVESFRPVPGGSHLWQNHQYAQSCDYAIGPDGKITATCARQTPPPPPPGGMFSFCEGGQNYTRNNQCIRIPAQAPGGSIKLRGFNFITPSVKVILTRPGDPLFRYEVDCAVWGDRVTPLKDADDHFIVDERVCDWVDVPLPPAHPNQPGAPVPAGLYELVVEVANVTNAVYDSATPPVLRSNRMLLRLEADPNVRYLLWSERGRCNRETPGMGDDEIWWDAFSGHFVPKNVPVPPIGASALELRDIERRSFPRPPWEDMDDGESAGAYRIDVFGPKAFELYGVAVIGVVGFEVDSESAARDQLQGFWNAWGHALGEIASAAFGLSGTVTGMGELAVKAGLLAAKVALTIVVVAVAIIVVVVLIATAFWAAWAPADLIALDVMAFDAATAWDRTEPKTPLPPPARRSYGSPYDDEVLLTVWEAALPKLHLPGDAAATWVQEVHYDTPEEGEDASYMLEFRLARS